jgi:hypothetical protein
MMTNIPTPKMLLAGSMVDWSKYENKEDAARDVWNAMCKNSNPTIGWELSHDSEEEQKAFEDWAKSNNYDMKEHPIHYLFLDPKTYSARSGWKAGRLYEKKKGITNAMVDKGMEHYSEGGCSGLADYERREVVRAILEAALNDR